MRVAHDGDDARAMRVAVTMAVVLAMAVLAILVIHVHGYFFVLDDYALVGEARTSTLTDIVSRPLFGFYRPFTFVVVQLETRIHAWSSPWGYAAFGAALHAMNAVLVGCLARQMTGDRAAATIAAAVFWASPWAAEAYFWTSGRFDLLAALGTLATLVLAGWAGTSPGRWIGMAPAVFVTSVVGVSSKEHAVVLPLLLVGTAVCSAVTPAGRRRMLALVMVSSLAVVAYLAVRQAVVPSLGGAYGDFGTLVRRIDPRQALAAFAAALVQWPLPSHDPADGLTQALVRLPAIALVAPVLGCAMRRRWPVVATCAVLGLVSMVPTIWAPASGRFLYLPGAWFSVAVAACLAEWVRAPTPSWVHGAGRVAPLVFLAVYAALSVQTQAGWWAEASAISRAGVASFSSWIDRGVPAVHITNLPFRCAEGPVILTSYAFGHYYRGHQVPSIRATAHIVRCEGGRRAVLSTFPDPLSIVQALQEGERDVALGWGR